MYPNSLRAAASSGGGTRLVRLALERSGGTSGGGGGAVAAPGCGRSFSATPAASAPVQGAQGVGMEQLKQPQQNAVHGDTNTRDGAHKGHWDPITHSFGEGYSTRADEDGFGTVYAKGDDEERPGHPEYDTSQGSEVREKEKGRHIKDDRHAT